MDGKRAFDIAVSGAGIIFTLPLLVAVGTATAIRFGRNPFYLSERVGLNGQTFKMIKFRTFKHDIPEGSVTAEEEKEQLSRFGRFLKITALDEFPQLINVLKGDMSIVGPRPHTDYEIGHLSDNDPLFSIRPGLTGPWQVASIGIEVPTSMAERIEMGREYAEQDWSMQRDIKYLFQTFKREFWNGHDGAKFEKR